jgi:hypothetical protein
MTNYNIIAIPITSGLVITDQLIKDNNEFIIEDYISLISSL